jgi:hypothetical protein
VLKFLALLFFTLILTGVVFAQTKPESPKTIVFSNVTVIDVKNGRQKHNTTVVIIGNRIAAVGQNNRVNIPENAQIIDARGKFLIPSLWDMHIHAWDANAFYPILLANGVTGIRNMGGDVKSLAVFQQQIETGKRIGPRLFFAGQIIDGLWRENLPFLFSYVANADEGRTRVRQLKVSGADFIKVYNALTPYAYTAIANEAKRQNLAFAGHVPFSIGVRAASTSGQRSIEHLYGIAVACSSNEKYLMGQVRDLLEEMHRVDNQRIKEMGDRAKELQQKTYGISNQLYELTDNKAFDAFNSTKCAKLYELFRGQNTW